MTRKTTAYARKRARMDAFDRERYLHMNHIKKALVVQDIAAHVERLRTGAALHAYTGDNALAITSLMGRLIFVTCYAAGRRGLGNTEDADLLIAAGGALAEIAETPEALEAQRSAVLDGLDVIDRLLPHLHPASLAAGELELERLLADGDMGTADLRRALDATL